MRQIKYKYYQYNQGQGFALPLVLIAFMLISLIAGISVKVSLMGENLGRNQADRSVSQKMAELALMDARDDILCTKTMNGNAKSDGREFYNDGGLSVDNDTCTNGLCGEIVDTSLPKYWDTVHSSDTAISFADYGTYSGRTAIGSGFFGSSANPRYIIEAIKTKIAIGDEGNNEWQYRITAVGFGKYNRNIFTKIQEVYRAYEGVSKCSYGDNATFTRNFSPTKNYNQ